MRVLVLLRSPAAGPTDTDHEVRRRVAALSGQAEVAVGYLGAGEGEAALAGASRIHAFDGAQALSTFLGRERVDVVVACDAPEAFAAMRDVRYRGVMIAEVHHLEDSLGTLWDLRGAPPMDGLIVPAAHLAEVIRLELRYGDALPIEVVPYGVEGSLFDFRPPRTVSERPVVLWVGGLQERHNWRSAVEIAARVRARGRDVELWLVGGGTPTEDEVKTFAGIVARSDLLDRCRWVAEVDHERMPRFYSMAAASGGCHLITTLDLPFPVSGIEALACRCPVVACDDGATAEVMSAVSDWGLYHPAKLSAAAGLIESVVGDVELRQRVIESARAAALERYGAETVAAAYVQAIRDLVEQPPATTD